MSRSSLAGEPAFDVPDLEIAEPRALRAKPVSSEQPSAYQYEPLLEREREGSSRVIELEETSREVANHFITGIPIATPGIPISRFASSLPEPLRPDPPFVPPTKLDVALDVVQTIPFDVWKRLPTYAFLAMILGNGCMCGGLSRTTNVAFAIVIALGILGLVGSLCQRRP